MTTSARNKYYIGNTIDLTVIFTLADGTVVDPTTINFSICDPDGIVVSYIYVTDAEVVKTGTGAYKVAYLANKEGIWYYKWEGIDLGDTDNVSEENNFEVIPSSFSE